MCLQNALMKKFFEVLLCLREQLFALLLILFVTFVQKLRTKK